MAEKVLMIALSPTMEEGTIVNWVKQEGDTVKSGDVLCEVETDKAAMDYETTQEGILLKIIVGEGSSAKIEQVIAVIGEAGEDITSFVEAIPAAGESAAAPLEKSQTVKAIVEQSIEDSSPSTSVAKRFGSDRIIASPLARKIADKNGIDLRSVTGSGPGGRIIKRDLTDVNQKSSAVQSLPAGDISIPHNGKRKVTAARLSESKFSAPHYYLKLSVSTDTLSTSRKNVNKKREKKIGFNPFIIKLTAEILKKHRYINAGWKENEIILFGSIDIALAVAVENGLITPVIKDCGSKSITQIDEELTSLIEKAKSGKLQPHEYTGAGFTISNLGSFGIEEFTAIINPPGSAILAIGAAVKKPVVSVDNSIIIQTMMNLGLSCDHRVIDGKTGALFLTDLKNAIEDPVQALL